MDDPVTMEVIQRSYFGGSAIFHRDSEAITDATITLSAMRPRPLSWQCELAPNLALRDVPKAASRAPFVEADSPLPTGESK